MRRKTEQRIAEIVRDEIASVRAELELALLNAPAEPTEETVMEAQTTGTAWYDRERSSPDERFDWLRERIADLTNVRKETHRLFGRDGGGVNEQELMRAVIQSPTWLRGQAEALREALQRAQGTVDELIRCADAREPAVIAKANDPELVRKGSSWGYR